MSSMDRRSFTRQMSAMAGATLLSNRISALSMATEQSHGTPLLQRMKWMNAPTSASISDSSLSVTSRPKTDFWRKTFYGYVTDNGHFFFLPVKGEFVFEARIAGEYAALYDQAGLMVRLDAQNWMKCGTEYFDNERHASVVFTRDFSDWSTMKDLAATGPVWWRVVRKKDSLETLCSADGTKFTSVRMGYFVPSSEVNVGVMCAAPEGPGFRAIFDNLKLTTTKD